MATATRHGKLRTPLLLDGTGHIGHRDSTGGSGEERARGIRFERIDGPYEKAELASSLPFLSSGKPLGLTTFTEHADHLRGAADNCCCKNYNTNLHLKRMAVAY